MAKGGRKYRLLLYECTIDRWWPTIFLIAMMIFINVGVLWAAAWYFKNPADNPLPTLDTLGQMIMIAVGVICLFFTAFLLIIRKMAYVQLFDDHLRLATPFLRLNISYKRVHRTMTAQIYSLFPPKSLSGVKREIIGPISGNTALVIHLTSYPLPFASFRLFLSPLFFYDKTPHFVLLVDDWMSFSTELDSRRVAKKVTRQPPRPRITSGLLDDLKRK
jgi:hypothetical protein